MTDQEVLRIAQKVIELQESTSKQKIVSANRTAQVAEKYHTKMHELFGPTGTIESAVRTVATYMAGGRRLSELTLEQHYKCLEIMDELFSRICNQGEEATQ